MNDVSAAWSRRKLLGVAASSAIGGGLIRSVAGADVKPSVAPADASAQPLKGRIRQSLVNWCYIKHFDDDVEKFCKAAKELGCVSIELIDPKHWPTLKKHGLTCAIASSHGYARGFANRDQWDECIKVLEERIGQCADFGVPNVISFTGMRVPNQSDEQGAKNSVEGFKKIVGLAEKKKVTIAMEMLNSRYTKNMIGHPGYQGDHVDYCIDIIKKVGSERLKLLFDIYHVQIMDGDVITRIRDNHPYIAHVHTAGVPGRGELDMKQEINYPPILETLLEVKYQGYVGQEFIPDRKDAMAGLREAVRVCDV